MIAAVLKTNRQAGLHSSLTPDKIQLISQAVPAFIIKRNIV
jgi:hypothetical protein